MKEEEAGKKEAELKWRAWPCSGNSLARFRSFGTFLARGLTMKGVSGDPSNCTRFCSFKFRCLLFSYSSQ
ncbi:hypothetical protein AMTR_s00013p00043590 [Amborella trichopoda]|uniref:Uncharacterized protein n=1 Tax=Amborella trichopoda TaxID=13333 RepID=W1PRG4_AMBTC|nr:hypothetical protein AMTR_s00013p00043590 [Amborella trichopoda]